MGFEESSLILMDRRLDLSMVGHLQGQVYICGRLLNSGMEGA